MEILKRCEVPKDYVIGKCVYCGSIVKCTADDTQFWQIITGAITVDKCPVCSGEYTMSFFREDSTAGQELLKEAEE